MQRPINKAPLAISIPERVAYPGGHWRRHEGRLEQKPASQPARQPLQSRPTRLPAPPHRVSRRIPGLSFVTSLYSSFPPTYAYFLLIFMFSFLPFSYSFLPISLPSFHYSYCTHINTFRPPLLKHYKLLCDSPSPPTWSRTIRHDYTYTQLRHSQACL